MSSDEDAVVDLQTVLTSPSLDDQLNIVGLLDHVTSSPVAASSAAAAAAAACLLSGAGVINAQHQQQGLHTPPSYIGPETFTFDQSTAGCVSAGW